MELDPADAPSATNPLAPPRMINRQPPREVNQRLPNAQSDFLNPLDGQYLTIMGWAVWHNRYEPKQGNAAT